jgi:hypothetical protein
MTTSDKLAAGALVISICAAVVSGLTWHEAHNQLLLSMKPTISFMTDDNLDDGAIGISITYSGPGPAVIKSVSYFMDKKPIGDVEKVADLTDLDIHEVEYEEGDTIGIGETQWLFKYHRRLNAKPKKAEDDFIDKLDNHLAARVEFCPVIKGECGKRCSTKGWCE